MKRIFYLFLIFALSLLPYTSVYANVVHNLDAISYSNDENRGLFDGKYNGLIDGYESAYNDYINNNGSYNYENSIDDRLNDYLTSNIFETMSDEYINNFQIGYKNGYEQGYNIEIYNDDFDYEQSSVQENEIDINSNSIGASHGEQQGSNAGSNQATIDFEGNVSITADESLSEFESKKSLVSRFYLDSTNEIYKSQFILFFRQSYVEAYNSTYLNLLNNFSLANENIYEINNNTVTINSDNYDNTVKFEFPDGSLYGYNYVSMAINTYPVIYDTSKYLYTSKAFEIDAFSSQNSLNYDFINSNKDFTMSINNDFGSDNIGIYEYKNGAWQYIYTNISQEFISHTFSAGQYWGGQYSVFLQPSYKTFSDIVFSPFSQEIYTYARRGAIYSTTDKFYPTANISRGELAYIINGVLNPNNDYVDPVKSFNDVSSNSPFYNASNFVYNNEYISGVSDSQFGLNYGITYNQLDIIIERIIGESYNMNIIFNKMISDKFHRSKGMYNLNNYVTKEEAVYILHDVLG